MIIFGVELEYDFLDADQVEAYERESQRLVTDIQEPTQYEGKSTSESFRIQCGLVDRFFDAVFGDGTAKRLFNGKCNLRDHMEAFAMATEEYRKSDDEINAITEKYSPNRAERRQAERANRKERKQGTRNYNRHAAGNGKKRGR